MDIHKKSHSHEDFADKSSPFDIRTTTNDVEVLSTIDLPYRRSSTILGNGANSLVDGQTIDALREFAVTESFMDITEDNIQPERDESFDGSHEQIVSADGEPWMNPVFRNSSSDPELFTTIERSDEFEDLSIPTPTTASRHSSSRVLELNEEYHLLHHHTINSNACLACLALHKGANVGEVTSDDSFYQLNKNKNYPDGITTALTTLTLLHEKATTKSPAIPAIMNHGFNGKVFKKEDNSQHTNIIPDISKAKTSSPASSDESLGLSTVGELSLSPAH